MTHTQNTPALTVKGRNIYNAAGEKVGQIYGDRPSARDMAKGARCNFFIRWSNGECLGLDTFSYIKDIVKYVSVLSYGQTSF